MTGPQPPGYVLPPTPRELLDECDVTYFMASGPGGQHRNRNRTAVRLRHLPTGVVVIGRRERAQRRNLEAALQRLRERVEDLMYEAPLRRPSRPTSASRERRLQEKRHRATRKRDRRPPRPED